MGPHITEPASSFPTPAAGGTDPLAIASLVCGLLALPSMCCCGCISLPLALAAIVLGVLVAMKPESESKILAYGGIATGAITLLLSVVSMALGVGVNLLSILQQQ